jgi:SAM-dependent methyltransferase
LDVVIWLRTRRQREADTDHDARRVADLAAADVAIDLRDPGWPIIRHIADRIAPPAQWRVRESQAFFAVRAESWDGKFGDDLPAYAAAVTQARIAPGSTALDVGCGTGRALPALRDAVGPGGLVIGMDLTPQMLHVAHANGRARAAALLLADAHHLPLADASIDTVFAAGLLTHLTDLHGGLAELARVTRPAGQLVVFHPTGRAALAARHGRTLRPDEPLAEHRLAEHLAESGWCLDYYDDPPQRFLALAVRR